MGGDAATIASDRLRSAVTKATWIDPRTGDQQEAQPQEGNIFAPPQSWEDAVLIIE
ncbi:MAG: putative collagen-binding domain-containing protein [Cyclobacteriaceae bacterium]